MREEAAREAAAEATRASKQTELAEDARRLAELAKLRLASEPSVRSLALIGAEHLAPALAFACPSGQTPLRLTDRTWWKCLHLLEAEGLTPPLKASAIATTLFQAIDNDADGAISCADAGYLLSLCTSGSLRDRVDAACDAPGAHGNGAGSISSSAALAQLHANAKARKACGPKIVGLLIDQTAADAETRLVVTPADAIDRSVATLFSGATHGEPPHRSLCPELLRATDSARASI